MSAPRIHLPASRNPAPRKKGRVRKIGMRDLPALAAALSRAGTEEGADEGAPIDSYAFSAAYYGFTGRHGLWVYEEDGAFIPFCRHPNVPGKILVFPGVSSRGDALARNLLHTGFLAGSDVQLARVGADAAQHTADRLCRATPTHAFAEEDEPVLDWRYPVYTLSTAAVCTHAGGAFRDFRKNVHRVDAARVSVLPLDIDAHYFDLLALTHAWARENESGAYSFEDLDAPHARILRMIRESGLDLRGTVIFMDGRCAGFTVWEMPASPGAPAVSVASLAHGPGRGLSEFLYLEMCRALHAAGIARVCIGGSESAGLDAFKRKMNPVAQASLKSIAVRAVAGARVALPPAYAFMGLPTKTSLSAPSNTSCE